MALVLLVRAGRSLFRCRGAGRAGEPGGFTCDNFRDVCNLELDPYFKDYLSNAFAPIGVYINFWHPTLEADKKHTFQVLMINDDPERTSGELTLVLEDT